MEGARYDLPEKKFVKEINQICKKNKIILILDEITQAGDRLGDLKVTGFKPDVIIYGKMQMDITFSSNWKKSIMNESTNTFVSSSVWTEKIGFTAGFSFNKIFPTKKLINIF